MSNNIALFSGRPLALKDREKMAAALMDSASDDPRAGGDSLYANFSGKRGVYEVGPDKYDLTDDELWLVDTSSFTTGWVCWKGGRPVAKRVVSIYAPPMAMPDLTEHGPFDSHRGEGWYQAKGFVARSLEDGTQIEFSTNSKSGVSSTAQLSGAVAEQITENLSSWPVIQFHRETFTAQGNKNHKPVFPVIGWVSDEVLAAVSEMEDIQEMMGAIAEAIEYADGVEVVEEDDTPPPTTKKATKAAPPPPETSKRLVKRARV